MEPDYWDTFTYGLPEQYFCTVSARQCDGEVLPLGPLRAHSTRWGEGKYQDKPAEYGLWPNWLPLQRNPLNFNVGSANTSIVWALTNGSAREM